MGKMTADELRRAGEAYRSENNGAQKSPVTVSANTEGSGKKMTASELRQAGEAYRKANGLSDPIYRESPATVVDKYSTPSTQPTQAAPSTQPTQAAPAGASSRKQSDAMKEQLDAIKKQRDDAAIKAGAYMRAGNMQQQAKEQQKIANKAAIDYENAYTQWKNQRNAEAVEDYNPDENKFKAGDAALSGLQNAFQSMGQYAAAASSYLSGNQEAQAWEAKRLLDSGVSGTEAVKRAGLADKREIPITDYKTQAELRHEKNVASVGAVEGGALQLVNTISNMVPSLVANAVLPGSGLPMMAASAAGNKYADAYEKYGNTDTAFVLGSAAGGASMLTEQFGGLYGSLGKSAAGQAVAKKLMAEAPGLYNLANSVGGKWLRDALSEGIEEGAEDVINYAIEKALTGDSDEMDNFGYDMLLGALAGGVFGGGNAAVRSTAYNRTGKALNASPEAVAQQVQEGLEKGAGTAPAIYAAEVQKNPSNQMVGRLYEANRTFDLESGLSKIQGDITQISAKEIKAMVSDAQALAQAAQKLNVEATRQAVATAITEAQRTESIKTAEDSVGQAFAPTVDNPANEGEKAYNSAIQGAPANQSAAQKVYNDPAARQSFSQLTGVQFSGNTAHDIAAIEVATQNIAKSGKQAVSQAEYAQRVAAAGEQAAAQFDADMQAQAEQMQRESEERWLSVEQNTITDVDGKRRIKEITNTDVRGNTEIGYKKAEITKPKKKAVDAVNNAAKYLGKTIVWYEGALQVNGQYRLANGFRAPDGTIYVNINSRDPLMVTFGHEMFHDLVADSKYSGLIDTLVENPDYADMVNGMMNAKTELYERNGIELDPNAAAEEVAADISGDLLDSRDMLEYIGARNTEAATGIKGFLNRILKKLKGKPSAQEAYNRLSEAQKALLDGMEGRTESTNSAEDAIGKYSVIDIANAKIVGDGDVDVVLPDGYEDIGVAITGEDSAAPNRYSLMSFGESDLGTDRFKYATRLAKATGVSVQKATDWIDSVYSVAAIIGDDKVRLDYEANRNNTSLKPNSEYDFSLDFSTLCAKRLLFSGTMDAIQSALPNTPLTSEDFVHLREIMKDSGYEVACGICYVESTRREFSTISEGFVEQYRKAQAEGTNIKKVNASGQTKDLTTSKGIENSDTNRFVYPEEGFTPTLADLVTAEGIDRLQVEHPEVYKAFNAYMNARGQQKPKMIETRTDYRGEILNMTKGQVSRRNSHGGLRIQSFSDFEVPHLIDMMQAVYDMASMGLKGQAYTKVPSFARAMGQTGIKINLSLIAKGDGVDANGKLIFDDVEGMPSSEAFAIRNDPRFSENVGTILVGKNVKHIVTAMADPEIDFIIPFHKSSWSASLYKSLGLEGYEDFTDYQNEKKAGAKIENYDPSEYWDFSKSGDENAQIYLAKCKADGRIPKFAEVMYNGKSLTEYPGYWKLLIDFKMYNNDGVGAPQQAVKPVFDDEFNAKLLNEYNGGHRKLPVARDIVDRFLKEKSEGSYSLMDTDSTGRELSAEQREYFKDSKVRDEDGNLLVVYHGTDADFTVFDASKGRANMDIQGMFFSPWELDAQGYGKNVSAYYLNITNPASEALGYKALNMFKGENNAGVKAREYLQSLGYDGVNNGDEEYIAFSPEQIKLVDNTSPTESNDIRYSLMEDAQYMADIDKAVSEATKKADDELKAAQAEVKELRQQLLDYRQQADAEAKMNERWRDAETKLVADLAAAKEREKAAKARAEFMAKYDALAKQYRADLRANNQQAQEKYNEKLSEAKDEFNRRRTQDRIDRVVREDQAKSKARLRAAEQKSTTTDDVAKVLTEMPKKDKEAFKAKIAESWRTFKRQWINTKDELERFGNEVGDNRIMYAANNVGQASAAAQYSIGGAGQYDLNGKKIGDKNLMQVFEPAKNAGLTDEFYTYLLHEHNVDRMSVREKAQRQLAELRAKLGKEVKGFAEMTDENIATAAGKDTTLTKAYTEEQIAAAKQYKQFQALAEKQFDKPVFGSSVTAADSRAAADKLLKEHPEFEKWAKDVYAYLDGLMEVRKQGGLVSADMAQRMKELYPHYVPTYRDMPSTSGGYSNPNSVAVNSTIKAAKGGNQDIIPLIDSIARQTLQTFSAAKKNILGNMLYEDAMDTTRDISEYIQNVTEDGELVDLDADTAEKLDNTLRIWVDGKPVTLHMSEAMADGFRPIEQSNSFGMKALRSINSTFKKLVTQWNPVFIVRNFVRDAQSALYFTHYSNATFIKNYGKAVKEIATNGKYWQLYQAMGGKGTTYYDPKTGLSDRHHFKNGAVDKVAGGLNRVIDILSFANEAVEQYPRLAEFISTMEDTGDVQQALYNAADITTNFGRGGFSARKLNASLVPFFNPGMQGLSKNIRNVIDRRGAKEIGQLISRLLLNGVMPGIIMSLVYDGLKEDEDYKELSNYIKDSNILIKIGDNKFIKVPMGREPSVITAFTNRMWRWLKGEPASSAFADYPSFAIEQLAPNNPLTNNIFAGITAMSTNKNWYGGDIVSSYMEEKPDYLQYDESTDAFSIWLGEITRHGKNGIEGLSPKKVNYLIDQYSGFIGDWVLPALSKKADVPAVVKAFVVDSVRQNRLGSDFYDALDEAKQVKETEFSTAADDATYSYLYKQSKAASEITKQLKEIYNSGEKTRKEKMSEARDLLELRNEIYRNALLTVSTYEETAKSIDSADSDVVKREANRKAFGAEYALKTYNKDVGEKAAEYVAQGVTYDQYYAAYFATRGITGDKDENGKTITNSASRKKKEAIDKAVPNATTKQKHLLYEALGVSEKVW